MRWLTSLILIANIQSIHASDIHQWASFAPGMRGYERNLIALALEASKPTYGEYNHKYLTDDPSWRRVLHDLNEGGNLHIAFSVGPRNEEAYPNIHQYVLPDYRNLLGFRQIIVRRDDLARFTPPLTLEGFKQLRPGQGENWREVFIYQNAGLPLVTAPHYDQLFPMLKHKRFDYIALGLVEMGPANNLINEHFPELVTHETIYIYYPLKMYIFISSKIPQLSERLKQGLDIIFNNGSEEKLFHEQFDDSFERAGEKVKQIIVLDDPLYSAEENHARTLRFLEHYKLENKALYLHEID